MKALVNLTKTAIARVAIVVFLSALVSSVHADPTAKLEPLYGFDAAVSTELESECVLAITVRSTGCTSAEDFSLALLDSGVGVVRTQSDRCRKKPFLHSVRIPIPARMIHQKLLNPLFLSLQ